CARVYGNAFNYTLLSASMIAAVGLVYCIGRTWLGSKPSLTAGSTFGVLVGTLVFALGFPITAELSERHLNRAATQLLLGFFLVASVSACCAIILKRSRQVRSGRSASVLAIAFGVISVPALGF